MAARADAAVIAFDPATHDALDAASAFHANALPQVLQRASATPDSIAVVLPPAPYDHADWRRAVARDLARRCAPVRVNLVAGSDRDGTDAACAYLARAHGVTGHYLILEQRD